MKIGISDFEDLISISSLISEVYVRFPGGSTGNIVTVIGHAGLDPKVIPYPYQANPSGPAGGSLVCYGHGFEFFSSLRSCVGEAIERWSLFNPEVEFVWTTISKLESKGLNYISPTKLVEFGYAGLTRPRKPKFVASPIPFVKGLSPNGDETYIPAEAVYFLPRSKADDSILYYTTTNGVACHTSRSGAMRGALLELMERNDFMMLWIARELNLKLANLGRIEFLDGEMYCGRINTISHNFDDYSTYLVVSSSSYDPTFFLAAGTSTCAESALRHALGEALMMKTNLRQILRELKQSGKYDEEVDSIAKGKNISLEFGRNVLYYSSPVGYEKIKPVVSDIFSGFEVEFSVEPSQYYGFLEGLSRARYQDSRELDVLLTMFARLRITPVFVDITPPYLRGKAYVYRCVCLDLVPLTPPYVLPLAHPSLRLLKNPNKKMHPFG